MAARLDRRDVVRCLLAERGDTVVVTGLGASAYDVAAAGDHDRNFYLWGAMGGAATIGLGLALAQPDLPVLVVTGDGEMLMGMGAFATIGAQNPKNLTVVVLDNEAYGETGGQETHTARGTDLAAVARACGIADAATMTGMAEVEAFARRVGKVGQGSLASGAAAAGSSVAVIKIDPQEAPKVLPSRDGIHLMNRVRSSLGFAPL